jgi:hypothetical protein
LGDLQFGWLESWHFFEVPSVFLFEKKTGENTIKGGGARK